MTNLTNQTKASPLLVRAARAAALPVLALALATVLGAGRAEAQVPRPSPNDPGMIGGRTIGSGRMVLGASTGYPETRFHVIWGMGSNFDLGIQPGLTYCGDGGDNGNWLCGLRQDVGLDFQVPLRWTLATMPKAAIGLRVSPFLRVGEWSPAFSFGSLVGARFSIALPKVFSLIVGPEARFAFATIGEDPPGRANGFDAAIYAVIGLESFFKNKWLFNLQFDAGGYFGSDELWDDGMFNAYVGFGAVM